MSQSEPNAPTFEESLKELEQIVRELEDGQLGLDESLNRYETGVGLLKRCYTHLRNAEQRILVLTGTDDQGRPLTAPFEHAATAEESRPEEKRKRKPPDANEKLFK